MVAARIFSAVRQRTLSAREHRRRANLTFKCSDSVSEHPTIYFLAPDLDVPVGGCRVIYRHVDILNAAGHRALALHRRSKFRYTWFNNDTLTTDLSVAVLKRGDLLVVPERDVDLTWRLPRGIAHVIFNQGIHLTWHGNSEKINEHYSSHPDLAAVITVSEHSREVLQYAFKDLGVYRLHLSIDPSLFHLSQSMAERRISYMPRRGGLDADAVLALLRSRGGLKNWQVLPLHNLRHEEVGEQLRTSRIFLTFAHQEGFGLPPAEAMACGNYVIGYHAFGGREYFQPDFSMPIGAGDILSFATAVEQAIIRDSIDPNWCFERGRQASSYVLQKYSVEQERDDVIRIYASVMRSIVEARI